MITDIECRSEIGPDLDRAKLNPYWNEYFSFLNDAPHLHSRAEMELRAALNLVRNQPSPFLDAQQAISKILTRFGGSAQFPQAV